MVMLTACPPAGEEPLPIEQARRFLPWLTEEDVALVAEAWRTHHTMTAWDHCRRVAAGPVLGP